MNSEEWVTDENLNIINNDDYLLKKALRSKSAAECDLYKASSNRVTLKIKEANGALLLKQTTSVPIDQNQVAFKTVLLSSSFSQLQTESSKYYYICSIYGLLL